MKVFTIGGELCLTPDSNELMPIKAFNTGGQEMHNVEVAVEFPSELVYSSHVASQGTFSEVEEGVWVWEVGTLTTAQNEENPETLEICFTITDDTGSPFVVTFTVTCDECPDESPEDNSGTRTFEGTECTDLTPCIESIFGCLEEYDSMIDALAGEGKGQVFAASFDNIHGWSYRALLVTPIYSEISLTAPADMVDNPCDNICNGEVVGSGQQPNCEELLPIVEGPCGVLDPVDVSEMSLDEEGAFHFTITYFLSAEDCLEGIASCCLGESAGVDIIIDATYTLDDPEANEGTVEFTVQGNKCLKTQSVSYHYQGASC